jgi:hypothetical protein
MIRRTIKYHYYNFSTFNLTPVPSSKFISQIYKVEHFDLFVLHIYQKKKKHKDLYSRNVIDVDWGLVVKLALAGKVTRRACKIFGIYDRFLTNVQSVQS